MVSDTFGSLMEELGKLIHIKLVPDRYNSCLIKYKNGLKVQIQIEPSQEILMFCSELGQLVAGRYRENVMREALKANGLPEPPKGLFAFSQKTENLVLYGQISLHDLTAPAVHEFLEQFLKKAMIWYDAIAQGAIPSFAGNELSFGQKGGASGMFGLT